MNKEIVIIDYQLGNLFSVNQALINIGLNAKVTSDPKDVLHADAVILPGVGAFRDAMINLDNMALIEPIRKIVEAGKPLFGICLGLQLLFESSDEFGASEGLGLIEGDVRKFKNTSPQGAAVKVPQIAWNTINKLTPDSWNETPLEGIEDGENMYFVHSYYINPRSPEITLTETTYGGLKYTSSILKDNIFACQFHPEKSADKGIAIYRNWAYQNKLLKN